MRLLIGIDDTDNESSIGTGKFARNLCATLVEAGLGISLGVTRHQLLVDPRIPYTSHNSAAAIVFEASNMNAVAERCREFYADNFHAGSDPGLCIAEDCVSCVSDFGRAAQCEVLTKEQAYNAASVVGCLLEEHGGTGDGIIGALAAVGLRAGRDDGRYLDYAGCRGIEGVLTAGELIERSGVDEIRSAEGFLIDQSALVDTQDWVRPELVQGRAVIMVERRDDRWITRRKHKA